MASELFETIASLIEAGANIEARLKSSDADDVAQALTEKDNEGNSLLHLAVSKNNANNAVESLLDAAESHSKLADVHMLEDAHGNTPLYSALANSHKAASNELLLNLQNDKDLSEKIYLKVNELDKKTDLHHAIEDTNPVGATNLLEVAGKVMSPSHKVMLSTVLLTMRDSTPHGMTAIERGLSDEKNKKAIDTTNAVIYKMLGDGHLLVMEILTSPNKMNHCMSPLEQIVKLDNVDLFKTIMGKAKGEKAEDYQGKDAIKDILSYHNPEGKTLAELAFEYGADNINAYIIEGISRDDSIGKQLIQAIGSLNAAKADASAQQKLDAAQLTLQKTQEDLELLKMKLDVLTPQKDVKIKILTTAQEAELHAQKIAEKTGQAATTAAKHAEKAAEKAEFQTERYSLKPESMPELKPTPDAHGTKSSMTKNQKDFAFHDRHREITKAALKKHLIEEAHEDANVKSNLAKKAAVKVTKATKVVADATKETHKAVSDLRALEEEIRLKEQEAANAEKAIAEAQALQFKIHAGLAISKAPQAVEDISSLIKSWIGYDMAKGLQEYSVLKPLATGAAGITGAVLTSNPVLGVSSIYQNQMTQDFIGGHFLSADNLTYLNAAVTTGMVAGGVLLGGVTLPAAGAMLGLQALGVGVNYAFDKGSASHVISKGLVDLASTGMTWWSTPGALLKTLDVIHGAKIVTDMYFNYPKGNAPAIIYPKCYTDEAFKDLTPEEKTAFKEHQEKFFQAEVAKYCNAVDAPDADYLHSAFVAPLDHDYAA